MTRDIRLTAIAHREVGTVVAPGDVVVDATAGNGHDTLFLAQRVGASGRVYALDIQREALERTSLRLTAGGLAERVTLIHRGHEALRLALPMEVQGRITAVMFNLGYLPGGERQRTTSAATTIAALDQAVSCLRPDGILSVIAYPGHRGGGAETAAVCEWFRHHPALAAQFREIRPAAENAPLLLVSRTPISHARPQPCG